MTGNYIQAIISPLTVGADNAVARLQLSCKWKRNPFVQNNEEGNYRK